MLLRNIPQPVMLSPWGIKATLLPNQMLFDPNNKETENSRNDDNNPLNLQSFAGLFTTPEKDKSESKKEIEMYANKEYDAFEDLCGDIYSNTNDENLPKMLQVDVSGVKFLYPTVLIAVVVDELIKDDVLVMNDKEDMGPSTSCENKSEVLLSTDMEFDYITGLQASRKLFEEALSKPERNESGFSFCDLQQKGEFCIHCGTTEGKLFLSTVCFNQ